MCEEPWEPVSPSEWNDTPHMDGKVARELDVKEGRAVFYQQDPDDWGAEPLCMTLPRLAIWTDEDTQEQKLAIIIQAETGSDKQLIGVRFFDGGSGLCLMEDLELIDENDVRFLKLTARE